MNRIDVINNLIKNNGYKKYLEIGVQKGESFNGVNCYQKIGVDPDPKSQAFYKMTSDEYFKMIKGKGVTFDVIFIDGLHEHDQCTKDIYHSLSHLTPNGVIVCHDMLPTSYEMQKVPRIARQWTGDVWRSWMMYRSLPDYTMEVYDFDYGVGVMKKGKQKPAKRMEYKFNEWFPRRYELMNVVDYENRQII